MIIKNERINEIKVQGVEAKIELDVHNEDYILVEIDNDKVPVKENKRSLVIGENKSSDMSINNGNVSISIGRNFNMSNVVIGNGNVVCGGNVYINGKKVEGGEITPAEKANITIKVPFNQIDSLDSSFVTNWVVNEISKKLTIETSGSTELSVRNIDELEFDTSGQTKIIINEVKQIEIDGSGQTNAEINSQAIESLEADLSGQSSIIVNSNIEDLEADLSGMSSLIVNGNVEDLEAELSGMSKLNVYGKVKQSEYECSRMSSVHIRN